MIPTNGFSLLPSHTGLMYVYFPSPVLILSSTPILPFRPIIHPCSYTTEAKRETAIWTTWVQSVTRRNGLSIPLVLWVMAERVGFELHPPIDSTQVTDFRYSYNRYDRNNCPSRVQFPYTSQFNT